MYEVTWEYADDPESNRTEDLTRAELVAAMPWLEGMLPEREDWADLFSLTRVIELERLTIKGLEVKA